MGSKGGRSFINLEAPPQSPNSRRAWHSPSFWLSSMERISPFFFYKSEDQRKKSNEIMRHGRHIHVHVLGRVQL